MAAIDFGTATEIRVLPQTQTINLRLGGAMNVGDYAYIAADGDAEAALADDAGTVEGAMMLVQLADSAGVGNAKTAGIAGDYGTFAYMGPVVIGDGGLTPGTVGYLSDSAAGGVVDAAPGAGSVVKEAGFALASNIWFVKPGGIAIAGS